MPTHVPPGEGTPVPWMATTCAGVWPRPGRNGRILAGRVLRELLGVCTGVVGHGVARSLRRPTTTAGCRGSVFQYHVQGMDDARNIPEQRQ